MQVKGLDDEVGNEAARLLNELIGGGRELSATVVLGNFSSPQPVQVSFLEKLAFAQHDLLCLSKNLLST